MMSIFNFSSFASHFFSKVFIAIDIDAKVCFVKIIRNKSEKIVENFNKEIKTVNHEFPMEAVKLIKNYQKKYPFTYVCAMSKSYNQGVFRDKKDLLNLGIEPKSCKILEMEKWGVYIKNSAILENITKFSKMGRLDFLFSPFVLIYYKIRQNISAKTRLYILQERSNISLFALDAEGVYFGGHYAIEGEVENVVLEETPIIENFFDTSFAEMDYKDNDDIDIDESDDFDSDLLLEKLNERLLADNQGEENAKEKVDDITRISVVSDIIQNTLKDFYSNELHESKFIEEIVILDAYGISDEAVAYLEGQTMIETRKINVNIVDELIGLSNIQFYKGKK